MAERGSLIQVSFSILLYLLLLYFCYYGYKRNRNNHTLAIWGIILFILFPFWGPDYFHYLESFDDFKRYSNFTNFENTSHLESIYKYVYQYSPFYFIFRFVIWGGAFLLLWLAICRVKADSGIFLFLFVVFYLLLFSYARATLSVCMMVYGYTFLVRTYKNRLLSVIIGIAIILSSFSFHKSSMIIAIAIPLSFVRLNKYTIALSLVLLPIVIHFIGIYLYDYILMNDLITDDRMLSSFNLYTQNTEAKGMGIAQQISRYGLMIYVYVTVLIGLYLFSIKHLLKDVIASSFFYFFFWIVIIATIFAFITPVIHYRTLILALAPMVIVYSKIYISIRNQAIVRMNIYFSVFLQIYLLLYSLYLTVLM